MNLIKNKKICLNEFVAKKVLSARNLIKKCIRCGENFSPDKLHPYQKYCGYNCRTKAKYERKRKLMIKKCVICGNSFNPRAKQKTCSRKCSKRNKNSHSRRWNLKNWDNYGKYMKTYHKKQWKEYKEKYNIKSRNFVQQKVLISIINQILDFPRVIEEASFD
jgi:predicted nucleic acid-binding Zn ribbon protein